MTGERSNEPLTDIALGALVAGMVVTGVLWAAGALSARLSGHRVPHGHALGELAAFAHLGDPSLGWHAPVGPPGLYWTVTAAGLALVGAAGWAVWRLWRSNGRATDPARHPEQIEGLAGRVEVKAAAGPKALLAQAGTLRPSLTRPEPRDVGWRLGTSRGVACWMGVRDSMVLLGPPGAGKGLNIVIPAILDAPGAVITTSTRPDNLTATMTARGRLGPVGVFDPQGLAAGVPSSLRWSPVRGCERPQTAMIRAAALTADAGESVTEGSFWKQQTATAVRCLLHAAAVGGKGADALYEWSLSAPAAREAVDLLVRCPKATPHWDRALDAIIAADPKQRDSVWAMVANAFAALADPQVLDAVSPDPDEMFDPARFLRDRGTLFLLGTASGASATAGLVAALIEDVVEVARRLAAASQGARLDPPLALVLDEAANYPIPSLAALMSEGGGTGIPTLAVLQSLAQARDRWGREQAQAIWDASTVKVVLGGSSNADDLADISRMIGERSFRDRSRSWQSGGGTSWSESDRREPILDPAMIRTLKAGHGLLLLRSARPIMLDLQPWTARPDAKAVKAGRAEIERMIRHAAEEGLAS
jgi:type IV secretion system protein VirD4